MFSSFIRPRALIILPRTLTNVRPVWQRTSQIPVPWSLLTRGYVIKVGDSASVTKTFTENDVRTFADLVGDRGPIHLDAEYAKGTRFGKPVVQGNLTLG